MWIITTKNGGKKNQLRLFYGGICFDILKIYDPERSWIPMIPRGEISDGSKWWNFHTYCLFFFDLDGGFSNVFRYKKHLFYSKKSIYFTWKKKKTKNPFVVPPDLHPTAPVLLVPFIKCITARIEGGSAGVTEWDSRGCSLFVSGRS